MGAQIERMGQDLHVCGGKAWFLDAKRWLPPAASVLASLVLLLFSAYALPSTQAQSPAPILISALHYDGYAPGDADEAFQLTAVGQTPVDLQGWTVSDGEATAVFPGGTLQPGDSIWIARSAVAFRQQFGFRADWELSSTDLLIPDLGGGVLQFSNAGDELVLRDETGRLIDAVVYKGGDIGIEGWRGGPIMPYTPSSTFAAEGQILYRKRDETTGLPVPDTDTVVDWLQDPTDPLHGRRAVYPGWDLETFWHSVRITETAALTVAIGPDHLYEFVTALLSRARESIRFHGYTLESLGVTQVLVERARAGVQVVVLLEGGPSGGVTLEGKWAAAQIEAAGGQVYFMVNDPGRNAYDRYRNYHPKAFLLDDRLVLIGSENPGAGGMPSDSKEDGTLGHRGVFLATDAPGVVAALTRIFDADLDPGNHMDIVRWQADDPRFAPPGWFAPEDTSGGTVYPILWPTPLMLRGTFAFELISAPENSLRTTDSLLGLVRRVGADDTLYVQQLQEPPYWGPADASPETDPNIRLEAFIDAARRGARVRLLLDRFYDDPTHPRSNAATVTYVNRIASQEGLDLRALLSNVTGRGIHNKMVVARIGGRGYVHIGSLNGGEASNKINRELVLQVQSDEAYDFLARMFELDWALSEPNVFLPLVMRRSAISGRQPAASFQLVIGR